MFRESRSVPTMPERCALQTGFTMAHPHPAFSPPSEPAWDVTFTRLANAVRPGVDACAQELVRQFRAMGLGSDQQMRQTPRGCSVFLSVLGRRGLLCIVDITLIDGIAVGQGRFATLDIRLLDACGDVVAEGLARGLTCLAKPGDASVPPISLQAMLQAATVVFVCALGYFDLTAS
jgi:hypothetical protein